MQRRAGQDRGVEHPLVNKARNADGHVVSPQRHVAVRIESMEGVQRAERHSRELGHLVRYKVHLRDHSVIRAPPAARPGARRRRARASGLPNVAVGGAIAVGGFATSLRRNGGFATCEGSTSWRTSQHKEGTKGVIFRKTSKVVLASRHPCSHAPHASHR